MHISKLDCFEFPYLPTQRRVNTILSENFMVRAGMNTQRDLIVDRIVARSERKAPAKRRNFHCPVILDTLTERPRDGLIFGA